MTTPGLASSDAAQAHRLQDALAARDLVCGVEWTAETASTNAELLRRVRVPGAPPQWLVAGHQSAGRGRQGRRWLGAGDALLASLAWPFPSATAVDGLSLAVGVWVVQALQALGVREAALKWPNDVLLGGRAEPARKLAGVLIELADTPQARWAVIGIGLNLRAAPPEAAALDACGLHTTRWDLLQELAPRLLQALPRFALEGFAPWRDAWNALHAWQGRPVRVLDQGREIARGSACGADARGCLLLRTAQGTLPVVAGDVSLRLGED
jgi:BirA family biotin operon repressor/biotin-[acetyl-CoA-carboxylase] ligase